MERNLLALLLLLYGIVYQTISELLTASHILEALFSPGVERTVFALPADEILCAKCYTHIHSSYYGTYCSGYCSGLHGSQYCYNGNYVISGGAIAGLIIGVLAAAAIFVVIVVICIKGGCNKGRPGRVVTTTGTGIGTHVAVTHTSHNPGYMQPMNPYGYSAPPPPSYGMMYPQAQQVSPAYPPALGVQQGYSAPAQPQYSSVYNQPVFGNLPRANM